MNNTLSQALAELDLKPGQCELVQVNGYHVEIRRPAEEMSQFADMVMLQPWAVFPDSEKAVLIKVHYRPHPLPVPPDIPSEEETTE